MIIRCKKLREGARLPARAHVDDAGADLSVCGEHRVYAGHRAKRIPTGFAIEIPHGYAGLIFSRSSTKEQGIEVSGVIDSQYRGEVHMLVEGRVDLCRVLKDGERIAQLVIVPVALATFEDADELSATERGRGGFGSTNEPIITRDRSAEIVASAKRRRCDECGGTGMDDRDGPNLSGICSVCRGTGEFAAEGPLSIGLGAAGIRIGGGGR